MTHAAGVIARTGGDTDITRGKGGGKSTAHTARWHRDLTSRIDKNLQDAFFRNLLQYIDRAWGDIEPDIRMYLPSLEDSCGNSHVLHPGIDAGSYEGPVDIDAAEPACGSHCPSFRRLDDLRFQIR